MHLPKVNWTLTVPVTIDIRELDGSTEQEIKDLVKLRCRQAGDSLLRMIPGAMQNARTYINHQREVQEAAKERAYAKVVLQAGTSEGK